MEYEFGFNKISNSPREYQVKAYPADESGVIYGYGESLKAAFEDCLHWIEWNMEYKGN